jgi:cellulose synthase/poly-beta-1,6-N-acetylglucosamine synthase-like glycosyltransferase
MPPPVAASRVYGALGAGYLVLLAGYLGWRISIVDWSRPTGFPTLFADVVEMMLVAMVVGVGSRPPRLPAPGPGRPVSSVDIFIPTLHEPLAVIGATALGATGVRGRNQVWLLDDGRRGEVADLARRLGVRYLSRHGNADAKAGNLNAALPHSTADLILILDADQIPLPGILDRLLPYFADPAVALVQTPQAFYNTDSVSFRPDRQVGEQDPLYHWLQPAKNADNSAFWMGSGGVLRRSALLDIGGFATAVTEDPHTTLRLHARGWRSVYLPVPLSYGLEAGNLQEYYRQRRRWAAGNLFILFRTKDSPLWLPGLTVAQRLHYVCVLGPHLLGAARLLAWLVPLLYLATGVSGVTVPFAGYAIATLGLMVTTAVVTTVLGRGWHHPLWTQVFAVASMLPQAAGFVAGAVAGNHHFSASRKTVSRVAPRAMKRRYQLLLAVLLAGLVAGGCRMALTGPSVVLAWATAALGYQAVLLGLLLRHVHRTETAPPGRYEGLAAEELYRYVLGRHAPEEKAPEEVRPSTDLALAQGDGHRVGAVAGVQPGEDPARMGLHGVG